MVAFICISLMSNTLSPVSCEVPAQGLSHFKWLVFLFLICGASPASWIQVLCGRCALHFLSASILQIQLPRQDFSPLCVLWKVSPQVWQIVSFIDLI